MNDGIEVCVLDGDIPQHLAVALVSKALLTLAEENMRQDVPYDSGSFVMDNDGNAYGIMIDGVNKMAMVKRQPATGPLGELDEVEAAFEAHDHLQDAYDSFMG